MEWKKMENGKKKRTAEIVANMSLPVDRLTATDCNAAARAKVGYNRNRIFRPDTGMEAKSGSGIAGKEMLF